MDEKMPTCLWCKHETSVTEIPTEERHLYSHMLSCGCDGCDVLITVFGESADNCVQTYQRGVEAAVEKAVFDALALWAKENARAVRDAVAAERERCAVVAENAGEPCSIIMVEFIAAAIRAGKDNDNV